MRCLLLLIFCNVLYAQEVSFDVQPREIGINERVQFSIDISGQTDFGRLPSFKPNFVEGDFELLSRRPGRSSSTSIINGRASSRTSFTYELRPKKKGTLSFPSQTIIFNGKTYETEPITIEVGDENKSVTMSRDPFDHLYRRRNRQQQRKNLEAFARVEVPKKEYYLGEPIELDIMIYLSEGLYLNYRESSATLPDLQEFWVEDVALPDRNPEGIVQDGKRYRRYHLFRKRLFATKTGELTIQPADFILSVRQTPYSDFFSSGQQVRRSSTEVVLNIAPLPEAGKPKNFSGLVGRFEMVGELDKSEIKMGETASLQVELQGEGNFNAISELPVDGLYRDFEMFEGGVPSVMETNGVVSGKRWAYALVPRREGRFEVKLPSVSYFDLGSKTYKVATGDPFTIEVSPGQGLGSGTKVASTDDKRTVISEQNLAFIKLDELDPDEDSGLANPDLLVKVAGGFLAADLILFLGLFIRNQARSRMSEMRPNYALKNFRKGLTRLKSVEDDRDKFYAGLNHCLLDYFGDKWDRPGQGISLEMIGDHFHKAGIDESYYRKVSEVIEACDLARFTPSTPESRENLINRAREVIEEVEGVLA